jgi:hypothetical protein
VSEVVVVELVEYPGLVWFGPRDIGGKQAIFRFDNGWGASVILGTGSYGVELGFISWPNATIDFRYFEFDSSHELADDGDVVGYLDAEGLTALLDQIRALPSRYSALDGPIA